jgi:transposase, IS30 family
MSAEEREALSLGLAHGQSLWTMASVLGRAPSTVSREHTRNAVRDLFRACTAHTLALAQARQARRLCKLVDTGCGRMSGPIWSRAARPNRLPDASDAGSLTTCGNSSRPRPSMWTCMCPPRGALLSELLAALRQARRPRSRGTDRRGQISNMTPIAERPADVATRTVPGHWEGDLIKRVRNGSAVGTLVERTTRLVLLARMEGTDATSARQGFTKSSDTCPLRCATR